MNDKELKAVLRTLRLTHVPIRYIAGVRNEHIRPQVIANVGLNARLIWHGGCFI
jgi:hypothetical protein